MCVYIYIYIYIYIYSKAGPLNLNRPQLSEFWNEKAIPSSLSSSSSSPSSSSPWLRPQLLLHLIVDHLADFSVAPDVFSMFVEQLKKSYFNVLIKPQKLAK